VEVEAEVVDMDVAVLAAAAVVVSKGGNRVVRSAPEASQRSA
jgi:hypothetical protein